MVQYVLGKCSREEADTLVTVPLGKVAMLSMQKFSSNVIEKCMDRASEEVIVKYVHELADPAAMRPLLQVSSTLRHLFFQRVLFSVLPSFKASVGILALRYACRRRGHVGAYKASRGPHSRVPFVLFLTQ